MTQTQKPVRKNGTTNNDTSKALVATLVTQYAVYATFKPEKITTLEKIAQDYEGVLIHMQAQTSIMLGEVLLQGRNEVAEIGEGTFEVWCKQRLGITKQAAYNYIHNYEFYCASTQERKNVFTRMGGSILGLLTAPSTPKEVVDATFTLVEATNQVPTAEQVRETIKAAKQSQTNNGKSLPQATLAKLLTHTKPHGNRRQEVHILEGTNKPKLTPESEVQGRQAAPAPDDKTKAIAGANTLLKHVVEELEKLNKEGILPLADSHLLARIETLVKEARNGQQ